jgi:DSF synthase
MHDALGLGRPYGPLGARQYRTSFDAATGTIWGYFDPKGVPCFNFTLLNEFVAHDRELVAQSCLVQVDGEPHAARYYVTASRSPRVFNLGGDLGLFVTLIKSRDREALEHYARLCIDIVFARCQNYFTNSLTTIALVQGDALGGGFECALTSDVIVAEEGAQFGLPELAFNLIPGMGAYSLLSRRLGMRAAHDMVLTAGMHSAAELHALGIVDVLAPVGAGVAAVREWIARNDRRRNGLQAAFAARRRVHPIARAELDDIVAIWVDAALGLKDRDLALMSRIVRAQMRRMQRGDVDDVVATALSEEREAESAG